MRPALCISRCRFLQEIYGSDRTFFVVLLRHPLAMMRKFWETKGSLADCADEALHNWVQIQTTLRQDLQHIKHKITFHYEHFAMAASPKGLSRCIHSFDVYFVTFIGSFFGSHLSSCRSEAWTGGCPYNNHGTGGFTFWQAR